MSVDTLLRELKAAKVKLSVKEEKLVCELPKSGIDDALKRRLIENKDALKALLSKLNTGTKAEFKIEPRDRQAKTELSYSQRTLWLAQQLGGGKEFFNSHFVFNIDGVLDYPAFKKALVGVIDRHEVLRTCYDAEMGVPFQKVIPGQQASKFDVLDVVDMSDASSETVRKFMIDCTDHSFNLKEELPLKVTIIERASGYIVVLVVHHIATDGTSGPIFSEELCHFYNLEMGEMTQPLPPIEVQYGDFSAWQRSDAWKTEHEPAFNYWRDRIKGAPECHQLPLDFNRPSAQEFDGRHCLFNLSQEKVNELNKLAAKHGVTVFMIMHTILSLVAMKLSGQKDVMIGVPIANRRHSQLEKLIGFFVNTLPTRVTAEESESLASILGRNKQHLMQDFDHQELPVDLIVENWEGERISGVTPLFQILFVMQNMAYPTFSLPNATVTPTSFDAEKVRFDLELYIMERGEDLEFCWQYATSLFKRDTVERIHESFMTIMDALIEDSEQSFSSLNLVGEKQQEQIAKFEQRHTFTLANQAVHHAFEKHAVQSPDKIALVSKGQRWSYQELNAKANQLAHYLVTEEQVQAGDLVAFALPRSAEQIISILAILKVGAGYIPLDTSMPAGRLYSILENYPETRLICDSNSENALSEHAHKVNFTSINLGLFDSSFNANITCYLDAPCYVLHTSGSTGKPKAVKMTHKPLINLVESLTQHQPRLGKAPTWIQFASIGFDMSFTDTFMTLSHGGQLVLIEQDRMSDPAYLINVIDEYSVTTLNLPYAMLQTLSEHCIQNNINPKSLNCIISTAEQLKITTAIRSFFSRNSGVQLVNHYGPTETHVVTALNLPKVPELWSEIPSIGMPIGNVGCHILDKQGRPVAIGAAGELYFSGICLAEGYLNQPDLSAEKFKPEGYIDSISGRLYQTGDLAKWLPNGEIEYLGRRDKQIKIRGFRVEPGEIEANLEAHPDISSATVISIGEDQDTKLIAYFTAPETELSHADIVAFLMGRLPAYMCPALCMQVHAFATNTNGKIDQSQLPEPDFSLTQTAYAAPETETEKRLQKAWLQLLDVERVGRDDSFFNLGGHSLFAVRLAAGIQIETGINLPVRVILENPTLKMLAEKFDEAQYLMQLQKQKQKQVIKESGVL